MFVLQDASVHILLLEVVLDVVHAPFQSFHLQRNNRPQPLHPTWSIKPSDRKQSSNAIDAAWLLLSSRGTYEIFKLADARLGLFGTRLPIRRFDGVYAGLGCLEVVQSLLDFQHALPLAVEFFAQNDDLFVDVLDCALRGGQL